MTKKIFITGATGCIGSYVIDLFLNDPEYDIHLLVRNPAKLKIRPEKYSNVYLHPGDFANIEDQKNIISESNYLIHMATAWGGDGERINVEKTHEMFGYCNHDICEKIIYFSTASILGKGNKPVDAAYKFGTDYIKSKYTAYKKLSASPLYDKITVLFPTLVFGGDESHPFSHISYGIMKARLWYLHFLRFFYADSTFHFLHAKDIAKITEYILKNNVSEKEYVLGMPVVTAKEALDALCNVFSFPVYFRIKLLPSLVFFFAWLFRIKITPWDRFCIKHPFFEYNTVSPRSFGLEASFPGLRTVLEDIKILRCIL